MPNIFASFGRLALEVGTIFYGTFKNGNYMIIEADRKTINHDKDNRELITQHRYYITRNFEHFNGCEFAWDRNAPPYTSPATLIIEKYKCGISCRFVKPNEYPVK